MRIVVHHPTAESAVAELATRVATIHAEAAVQRMQKLTCPTGQKQLLLDAIITQSLLNRYTYKEL